MARSKKLTVYVVQRISWEYNDEFNERYYDPADTTNSIRSYLTREKAEAHRQELERRERGSRNPFDYGGDATGLESFTTMTREEFFDHIERVGFVPPGRRGQAGFPWWGWFDDLRRLTDEKRHAVWDALDLVRFFEVAPLSIDLEE